MKKIFILIIVVFCILLTGCTKQECRTDADCAKNTSGGDNMGMAIYPPCYKGKCEYPKNSKEWIEYCDMAESNARSLYVWNCYMNAAYGALKKSSPLKNYTIEWDDAFKVCEKYIPEAEEQCKIDVCDNLSSGDGNMKYNYPENKKCYREARINTSCNDGVENGGETDIDCGGECSPCDNGKGCLEDEDCKSNDCSGRFLCYNTCPDGLISENRPCNCSGTSFDSVTPGIPIGIYCCEGKTQRDICD